MSLRDVLADGVKMVDAIVGDLQATVRHLSWKAQDENGKPTFATTAGTERKALIEFRNRMANTSDGRRVSSTTTLTFTKDVSVNVRDEFVLPDGIQRRVAAVGGPVDPLTGRGYVTEVYLE